MANKETGELIIEAINFYMENISTAIKNVPSDANLDMDAMRKLIKLDDIKKGLEKKGDDE